MNENYKVYMHRFPNGKVYIGITSKKPEERWQNGRGYQTQNVYKAILKYGWDSVEHIVMFEGLTKEEAEEKEILLISAFNANNPNYGYNIENGGNTAGKHSEQTCKKISESKKGWTPSKETRERMSAAKKGKPLSEAALSAARNRTGHPLNEKQRSALLIANIGKVVSKETRRKQSEAHKWKTLSEEQKRKISESGKIAQRKCKARKVVQISLDGEFIRVWDCMSDAGQELGISIPHISSCCKGNRSKTGGFKWAYYDK